MTRAFLVTCVVLCVFAHTVTPLDTREAAAELARTTNADCFYIRTNTNACSTQVAAWEDKAHTLEWSGDRAFATLCVDSHTAGSVEFETSLLACRKEAVHTQTRKVVRGSGGLDPVFKYPQPWAVPTLNTARYESFLDKLSGETPFYLNGVQYSTPTRWTKATENGYAADYILDHFNQQNVDIAWLQPFTVSGYETANIIATKTGITFPDEYVVVGAHMDSTSQTPSTLAPGAIDNGSGAAGVMLLAEAFANTTFDRSVVFIAFSGEEQGLKGSYYYVDTVVDAGMDVANAIIFDMIGYSDEYFGVTIEGTTNPAILELIDLVANNSRTLSPALSVNEATYSFGSDHVPFQQAGIPAILLIEEDDTDFPAYHSNTDTVSWLNADQALDIVRVAAGAVVQTAGVTECVVGAWGEWGECDGGCVQSRVREGSVECPAHALVQTQACCTITESESESVMSGGVTSESESGVRTLDFGEGTKGVEGSSSSSVDDVVSSAAVGGRASVSGAVVAVAVAVGIVGLGGW